MKKKSSLGTIVEDGSLKQLCCCRDLEKAAALRRGRSDEIRASFLRSEAHLSSINERPVAESPAKFQEAISIPGRFDPDGAGGLSSCFSGGSRGFQPPENRFK